MMSMGSLPATVGRGFRDPVIKPSLTPRTVESIRAHNSTAGIVENARAESAVFPNSRREYMFPTFRMRRNRCRSWRLQQEFGALRIVRVAVVDAGLADLPNFVVPELV